MPHEATWQNHQLTTRRPSCTTPIDPLEATTHTRLYTSVHMAGGPQVDVGGTPGDSTHAYAEGHEQTPSTRPLHLRVCATSFHHAHTAASPGCHPPVQSAPCRSLPPPSSLLPPLAHSLLPYLDVWLSDCSLKAPPCGWHTPTLACSSLASSSLGGDRAPSQRSYLLDPASGTSRPRGTRDSCLA